MSFDTNIASSTGSSMRSSSQAGETITLGTESTDLSILVSLDLKEAEELINTTESLAEIDAKLEDVVNSTREDPFAHYKCAFDFEADHSEPVNIPTTKGSFCAAITEQVFAIITIQGGLQSYCKEINSGKHEFSAEFLESETKATDIAVTQLDSIKEHLKEVLKEVCPIALDDHDVTEELRTAYGHALPWITQYRQVARHNHVFYKVNVSFNPTAVISLTDFTVCPVCRLLALATNR
jgi:hypothetical protein